MPWRSMTLAGLVVGIGLAVAAFAVYRLTFVERYYERYFSPEPIPTTHGPLYSWSSLAYACNEPAVLSTIPPYPLQKVGARRPSFADAGWEDVVPVTGGSPPVTRPSRPGATFQVQPALYHADPALPQKLFLMTDQSLVTKMNTATGRVRQLVASKKTDDEVLEELNA